jgi:hypothetical protein
VAIKSLYREYFQKSKTFLYPALDIKRVNSIVPINTFISWENHYAVKDTKLICLYHLRSDPEFRSFEKVKLFGNRLFHDFKETSDDKAIYVFDFKVYQKDFEHFIHGRYSKMSSDHKKKIKNFYGYNSPNYAYVESFLHPDKYHGMYSQILNVKESVLEEVGELCDRPNFDQETLISTVKSLEMKREIS